MSKRLDNLKLHILKVHPRKPLTYLTTNQGTETQSSFSQIKEIDIKNFRKECPHCSKVKLICDVLFTNVFFLIEYLRLCEDFFKYKFLLQSRHAA